MQVQFYKSPAMLAAQGKDVNGNNVPQGAIIFGYENGGTKGKIYVQNGAEGTTNSLICYGDMDLKLKTIDGNAVIGEGNLDLAGFLKVNSAWEVQSYYGLPSAPDARIGDVWKVTNTGEKFYVKSKTVNNNIYLRFVENSGTKHLITIDCGSNMSNTIQEDVFLAEINDYTKSQKFQNCKMLDYYYIDANLRTALGIGDSGLRAVPVRTERYGLVVMMVIADTSKANVHGTVHCFALAKSGSVEMNSWEKVFNNTGEIIKCPNGIIPANAENINEFFTFGGGVQWELLGGAGEGQSVVIDDELTDDSLNPTQGRKVKQYVDNAVNQLNSKIESIGSSFDLKDSVQSLSALQQLTGVQNGDVRYVESEGKAYFAIVNGGTVTWKPFAALNIEWK